MERDYLDRAISAVKEGGCEMIMVIPPKDENVLIFPAKCGGETLIPESEFIEAAENIEKSEVSKMEVYFEIWQLKEDPSTDEIRFESLDRIRKAGFEAKKENYLKVYSGDTTKDLEGLFEQFNMEIPADYKAHFLSVSDVVFYDGEYFYVDSFGFKKIWEEDQKMDIRELPFFGDFEEQFLNKED